MCEDLPFMDLQIIFSPQLFLLFIKGIILVQLLDEPGQGNTTTELPDQPKMLVFRN
jgi:hypothetical protein